MAEKIIMPQGGQDLKFGTVVRWFKKEGDRVEKDELLCEVETEKAVFEVTAPIKGILLKILKQDGEEAEVLSAIGFIGEANEEILLKEDKVSVEIKVDKVSSQPGRSQPKNTDRIRISPKARKLARDHSVDISKLESSRSDGKITAEDIERAISVQSDLEEEMDITGGHIVPIAKIPGIAAKRLVLSWNQAPHFYVTVSVDMTNVLAVRMDMNASDDGVKISINDLIIHASANALKDFPQINASYRDENSIIEWDDINIGVATTSKQGLVVPVIENADQLSIPEISQRVKMIVQAAREGKQLVASPSHFTISNLGMYQIDNFSAIINPPESAILAVASVKKVVVVNEAEDIAIRDMMNLTLSLDHRIGDGVLAAEFLNVIKSNLENIKIG